MEILINAREQLMVILINSDLIFKEGSGSGSHEGIGSTGSVERVGFFFCMGEN